MDKYGTIPCKIVQNFVYKPMSLLTKFQHIMGYIYVFAYFWQKLLCEYIPSCEWSEHDQQQKLIFFKKLSPYTCTQHYPNLATNICDLYSLWKTNTHRQTICQYLFCSEHKLCAILLSESPCQWYIYIQLNDHFTLNYECFTPNHEIFTPIHEIFTPIHGIFTPNY
jgi:hypothetical protein